MEEVLKFREEASKIDPRDYTTDGIKNSLKKSRKISEKFGFLTVNDILRVKSLSEEQLKTLEDILKS